MKTRRGSRKSVSTNFYGFISVSIILLVLFLTVWAASYFISNYLSKALFEGEENKEVYFLKSKNIKLMLEDRGMSFSDYESRVGFFKENARSVGFFPKDVFANQLPSLDKNASLIVLDMTALSNDEVDYIYSFVNNGGNILFNFTSGFLDASFNKREDNLVYRLTGLKTVKMAKTSEEAIGFLSTRLFSPLTTHLKEGKALSFSLYDPLPIFYTPKGVSVDAYLTDWLQTSYPKLSIKGEEEKLRLSMEQSGLVWHGYKGEGSWVYFSFPGYVFLDSDHLYYLNLLKGMLDFLSKKIMLIPYPYIDVKNAVVVSLNAERNYETLEEYHRIVEKHQFPTTVFSVASLAQLNEDLTARVAQSKNIEFASRGYSHRVMSGQATDVYNQEIIESRKILQKITGQNIYGIRPTGEEISDQSLNIMDKAGYKYIFGSSKNILYPFYKGEILIFPRKGSDDFEFFMNLDLDAQQILEEMKRQVNVVTNLDGIYTFNAHTHLMAFSSNIEIIDDFFAYINQRYDLNPMSGKMIYDRVSKKHDVSVEVTISRENLILMIDSSSRRDVKNMHFEILVNPNIVLKNDGDENIQLIKLSDVKYQLIIKEIPARARQKMILIPYDEVN